NRHKLLLGKFCLDIRQTLFTVRRIKRWNSLPREVVKFPSLQIFKAWLDRSLDNLI
ncbi:hypothetical protein N308_02501, partial [Struthio camelus australis]